MAAVLLSLGKVKPVRDEELDSVARARRMSDRRAMDVLLEAQTYWSNMSRFRLDRERNKRYTYGEQWSDIVKVDGKDMTEEEYIMSQGNVPLKNNLIRRLVRNVLGVYRSQSKEPVCMSRDREEQRLGETMSTLLQANMQMNRMSEVYARSMEEFLISGFVVHRKWYGWRNEHLNCWTDYVQPNNFFVDSNMRDFRGWDVSCLGEVHDISFEVLVREFAKSPEDYARLARIYSAARNAKDFQHTWNQFGYSKLKNYDFMFCTDSTRCRVIEVWRKESKPRYRCHDYNTGEVFKIDVEDYAEMVERVNAERIAQGTQFGMNPNDIPLIEAEWFVDDYWYYYYLTPFGDILDEGETPYEHKSHPYVFKAYPYIDGEIHSFVADVIDQQRYTNRLVTMFDWIMRASAKGVLLFPEECLPQGMSIEDIADEWSRFNGVIMIKSKPGVEMPRQVSNNATNIGISELLNVQLKFFEDISGVHGALQGRSGGSSQSGALYAQQAQNAATSLLDLLDSFSSFVIDAAYKDIKNMQQYYDDKMVKNIAGRKSAISTSDANAVRNAEFDLSIAESTASPAYRQMQNDFLMQIWDKGQISLEQLLEVGSFPFADELLQNIKSQQSQMKNGIAPEGLSPEMQSQIQGGADMQAVNQLYDAIKGGAA
jgi:hypothetical protein